MIDLDEEVFRMPPLAMASIEGIGEAFLKEFAPAALEAPAPVDLIQLVEYDLPRYGIQTYAVDPAELGGRHAATLADGERDIRILVEEELMDNLYAGGRTANFARATLAHELGHAILHVPVIRRRRKLQGETIAFNRVARKQMKAYEDPEWQAWALGGCVLAPRRTIEMCRSRNSHYLADIYEVSAAMMGSHLRRLKM